MGLLNGLAGNSRDSMIRSSLVGVQRSGHRAAALAGASGSGYAVDPWAAGPHAWRVFRKVRQPIVDRVEDVLTTPSGTYPGSSAFVGGVLLLDGRVFCVPRNSTTARIYAPITDTLTTPSGTYPGSSAFAGGVLLPDGRVFCVPHSSTTARIYGTALPRNLPDARALSPYDNKL